MRHILVSIVFLFVFLFAFIGSVSAIVFPDFGSCLNPRIAASQVNSGTNHGVVGSSTAYSGTDSIYRLSDGNVLQCLCQDNGDGIQTIWFRASSMTQEDSAYLLANGWIYVPTGSA
ncbi:MAG TPA: hypothetical protein VLF20_01440 [Patescibacteria group bacterium]|nr:hypothetical protein [Patescibacteria group bacterium]